MNLQYIKYAQEVEKCGSINKAAQNLYITQPYLSYCLKELENNLGITLFTRSTNGSSITEEGKEFLKITQRLLAEAELIENKYKKEVNNKYIYRIFSIRSAVAMNTFINFIKTTKLKENYEFAFFETGMIEMIDSVYF